MSFVNVLLTAPGLPSIIQAFLVILYMSILNFNIICTPKGPTLTKRPATLYTFPLKNITSCSLCCTVSFVAVTLVQWRDKAKISNSSRNLVRKGNKATRQGSWWEQNIRKQDKSHLKPCYFSSKFWRSSRRLRKVYFQVLQFRARPKPQRQPPRPGPGWQGRDVVVVNGKLPRREFQQYPVWLWRVRPRGTLALIAFRCLYQRKSRNWRMFSPHAASSR